MTSRKFWHFKAIYLFDKDTHMTTEYFLKHWGNAVAVCVDANFTALNLSRLLKSRNTFLPSMILILFQV